MNEQRFTSRTGWLRASAFGADDGLVSTADLITGVAAMSVTMLLGRLFGTLI